MTTQTHLAGRIQAAVNALRVGPDLAAVLELERIAAQVRRMELVLDDVFYRAQAEAVADKNRRRPS